MIIVSACAPANQKARVNITYQQVAQFSEYRLAADANGSHAASPDGIYILYRIKNIDNSGTEAKPFVFRSHGLLLATGKTITNEESTTEESSADKILLDNQLASPISVPAGQTLVKPKGL